MVFGDDCFCVVDFQQVIPKIAKLGATIAPGRILPGVVLCVALSRQPSAGSRIPQPQPAAVSRSPQLKPLELTAFSLQPSAAAAAVSRSLQPSAFSRSRSRSPQPSAAAFSRQPDPGSRSRQPSAVSRQPSARSRSPQPDPAARSRSLQPDPAARSRSLQPDPGSRSRQPLELTAHRLVNTFADISTPGRIF